MWVLTVSNKSVRVVTEKYLSYNTVMRTFEEHKCRLQQLVTISTSWLVFSIKEIRMNWKRYVVNIHHHHQPSSSSASSSWLPLRLSVQQVCVAMTIKLSLLSSIMQGASHADDWRTIIDTTSSIKSNYAADEVERRRNLSGRERAMHLRQRLQVMVSCRTAIRVVQQERQRVAVGLGNGHFISVRQVSFDADTMQRGTCGPGHAFTPPPPLVLCVCKFIILFMINFYGLIRA